MSNNKTDFGQKRELGEFLAVRRINPDPEEADWSFGVDELNEPIGYSTRAPEMPRVMEGESRAEEDPLPRTMSSETLDLSFIEGWSRQIRAREGHVSKQLKSMRDSFITLTNACESEESRSKASRRLLEVRGGIGPLMRGMQQQWRKSHSRISTKDIQSVMLDISQFVDALDCELIRREKEGENLFALKNYEERMGRNAWRLTYIPGLGLGSAPPASRSAPGAMSGASVQAHEVAPDGRSSSQPNDAIAPTSAEDRSSEEREMDFGEDGEVPKVVGLEKRDGLEPAQDESGRVDMQDGSEAMDTEAQYDDLRSSGLRSENEDQVSAALEMVLEAIDAEVTRVNEEGAAFMQESDYEQATERMERAKRILGFREEIDVKMMEWKHIAGGVPVTASRSTIDDDKRLSSQKDKAPRAPSRGLFVRMPDGQQVPGNSAAEVFANTIALIGVERVKRLHLSMAGRPLIAPRPPSERNSTRRGSYYITTHSDTPTKAAMLNTIADLLGKELEIKLIV